MDSLQVKNPLYPLLSVLSSVIVLIGGLLLVRSSMFICLLLALTVLYALFGFVRVTMKSLLVFLPVSLVFALFSFVFNRDPAIALQMGGRILLVGLAAIPVLVLPQINLTRNLTQIRCPRLISLGMLIAVRFVPILAGEVSQIKMAMKTRGARAHLWNISCFYRAFLIPLLMRVISIADTLSLSLETRGFDLRSNAATVYQPIRFTLRDGLYLLLVLVLIGSLAVLG